MTEDNCCQEFARAENLSRRRFLQGVTAAGAAGMTPSLFGDALRQTSFAATTGGNVLVVISLRGGIDGLVSSYLMVIRRTAPADRASPYPGSPSSRRMRCSGCTQG